jgi:uncharacterized protein
MSVFIAALNIHPLKSAAAIPVESAVVKRTGFENDRLAMLVRADGPNAGKFITQRDPGCEKLSQLFAFVTRGRLIKGNMPYADCFFETPDGETQDVRIKMYDEQLVDTKVFASECKGYNIGDRDGFLSAYLGFPVNLVLYPHQKPRQANTNYARMNDIVSFADGYPLLVTSEPSLRSLQSHLPEGSVAIEMNRFRPNIVLDGNLPWEEDVMHHIRIGDEVELEIVKPCDRCIMTTIDPATSERNAANEPIATMVKTRRGKGDGLQGVFFGQNAIPRQLGTIAVGDKVEILSTRPLHPALEQNTLKFGL